MINLDKIQYYYLEEINYGILKQIPINKSKKALSVLDIGCGSGVLSEAIKKKGYVVWGIEINREAANRARLRIDRVINEDLLQFEKIEGIIGDERFEYIIFSNILEHLYDPCLTIENYLRFLKPDGLILVSVPNVAVWINRIKLLFGNFDYTDTGVMDKTHIRFFTVKTAKRLVKKSGCSIVKVDFTPFVVRAILPLIKKIFFSISQEKTSDHRLIIDSRLYKLYLKYVYPVEYAFGFLFKKMFAYTIIVVGKKNERP
ncbi:MAG TPA: class I SAM-dependent methyltransferase [Smithella sp.]|nr:class I SAM-dependent methyltransferase [Smithella sp.]